MTRHASPLHSRMRIIAGQFRGRRLEGPQGPGVRPTSDRLRETLFNILHGRVEDALVLDGFAGTGALGLEALSRGARGVTFVERDGRTTTLLERNIAHCGAGDRCTVIRRAFEPAAADLRDRAVFDLVLLDPPYDLDRVADILTCAAPLVTPGGVLVFEHSRRRPAPADVPGLARWRVVTAGDSGLAFYAPSVSAGS